MRKVLVIAVREFQASVRTKAFIITLVAMPVMMGGSIAVQLLLKDKEDISSRGIAIIDQTGELHGAIETAANKRNTEDIFAKAEERNGVQIKGAQIKPAFEIKTLDPPADAVDELKFELSEQIRNKELFAFAIIEPSVIDGAGQLYYYSNSPTYRALPTWLRTTVNDTVREIRFDREGIDPSVVAKASEEVRRQDRDLVTKDASGAIVEGRTTNRAASFAIPFGLMMLMFMVVMVGASPLVNSVLEEKMQRIAEVLLGSVPPFQLMLGKLIGTVGVSLTISTVYLAGAYAAVAYAGYASLFPTHLLWWFLLYQCLAVFMFGSLFIAVGAACSDMKESQSMLMPVMLVVVSPMFVWMAVLKAPSATFAVIVSLIPPATPTLMLMRQSIPPGVPTWQPLLGVVLVALTTLLFVFVAGRIFRVGMLMQGKGAKFGEMLRWALRG